MAKKIRFDHNTLIYIVTQNNFLLVSESVSGTIIVHLKDAMKIRGIRVGIYGRAYTQVIVFKTRPVSDGDGGKRYGTYTETYDASETYLNHRVT